MIAYTQTLTLAPDFAKSAFWETTPTRRAALAGWQAARRTPDAWEQIQQRLAAQQWSAAETILVELWRRDDQALYVYWGLAQVAQGRGELAAARQYTRRALWVQSADIPARVNVTLLAAEIEQAQGHPTEARALYQSALDAVVDYGLYGWGTAGWTPHAFFAHRRHALPNEVLPQLARLENTAALVPRLWPLAALYRAVGQESDARRVEETLQHIDPAFAP
jgi:tetratricopeptide (TPR) repeat protein